jgi:3-methyl-2-oxobutanoate hydroxymethyltransferase
MEICGMEKKGTVKKVTTKVILSMKQSGEKIAMLTAYDYLVAKFLDEAGVDIVLVGDSLGNVFQGQQTTLPVTLDEMIYHTKAVCRGVKRAMVVVDMPFLSYQVSVEEAVRNCGRVMKETEASGVKIEGGEPMAETIKRLLDVGIPVMGHLGLTPQSINRFGSYEVRARDEKEAGRLLSDSKLLDRLGVFSLVLEKIPAKLAKKVTAAISVPTIGIGAGLHCDGQVLVVYDMLGLYELPSGGQPRFVRKYAETGKLFKSAFGQYVNDVKEKRFPSEEESY